MLYFFDHHNPLDPARSPAGPGFNQQSRIVFNHAHGTTA